MGAVAIDLAVNRGQILDVGDASLQFGNSISVLTHDDYAFPL